MLNHPQLHKAAIHHYIMLLSYDFKQFWVPALRLFQLFAITSFDSNVLSNPNDRNVLIKLYHCLIGCALLLAIMYIICIQIPALPSYDLRMVMDVMLLLSIVLAHLVTLIESYVLRDNQIEIVCNVQRIVDLFEDKLKFSVDFRVLQRRYSIRCCITFVMASGMMILANCVLYMDFIELLTFYGAAYYSWLVMFLRKIQISFYVNVLEEMLQRVRCVLVGVNDDVRLETRWRTLIRAQKIRTKIAKTIAIVNRSFGWSITMILVQNIVDLLNTAYWIIIATYYEHSVHHLLGEYLYTLLKALFPSLTA